MSEPTDSTVTAEWKIAAGLYGAECAAVLGLVAGYRFVEKQSLSVFLRSASGIVTIASAMLACGLVAWVLRCCRQDSRAGSRRWMLAVAMNVLVVGIVVLVGEMGLRVLAVRTNLGERVGGLLLLPRNWNQTVRIYTDILDRADEREPYMVPDPVLGWTVGKGRRSEDGLYFISAEGVRSASQGPAVSPTRKSCRVALVGDSYTFGEVVGYTDTWGYRLEQHLRGACEVLNFGVPGYGVDQMYLRYLQDVRLWKPDLVILGFISHDAVRSLAIYSFLTFPDGGVPLTKPRFVIEDGDLKPLNLPLLSPRDTFSKSSVRELPFINYDVSYEPLEWDQPGWGALRASYILRLLISLRPPYRVERQETNVAAIKQVNRLIFKRFAEAAGHDGARVMVVYLPTDEDLTDGAPEPLGTQIVRSAGLEYIDLRDCMRSRPVGTLFNAPEIGGHYSPEGNALVANCLHDRVRSLTIPLQMGH